MSGSACDEVDGGADGEHEAGVDVVVRAVLGEGTVAMRRRAR